MLPMKAQNTSHCRYYGYLPRWPAGTSLTCVQAVIPGMSTTQETDQGLVKSPAVGAVTTVGFEQFSDFHCSF